MSGELVTAPVERHHCGVNRYGVWSELREATDPEAPFKRYYAFIHQHDAPGTVRVCDGCGKVWVAFVPQPHTGLVTTLWRPETWWERWRRVRRLR